MKIYKRARHHNTWWNILAICKVKIQYNNKKVHSSVHKALGRIACCIENYRPILNSSRSIIAWHDSHVYSLSVCLYVSCLCLWALLPDLNKMMIMIKCSVYPMSQWVDSHLDWRAHALHKATILTRLALLWKIRIVRWIVRWNL